MEARLMPILHGPAGLDVDQADLPFLAHPSMRREVNSGPLSERTLSGLPRSPISRFSTRVTRPLPRLVSAATHDNSGCHAKTIDIAPCSLRVGVTVISTS